MDTPGKHRLQLLRKIEKIVIIVVGLMTMKRVAVLVWAASNMQSIIDSTKTDFKRLAKVVLVISNNPNAYALERAKENIKLSA